MTIPAQPTGDHDQRSHRRRPQRRGRRPGKERVARHRRDRHVGRAARQPSAERAVDDAGQQTDLQAGDHDNMDESAGDHLLLQRGRQRGAVAEDDAQQQGGLRFRQGSIDGLDDGMPQPEERAVERVAAVRGHAHQAGAGHHARDALLSEVGPIVELVEAGRLLDLTRQQDEVSVVHRRHPIDGRLDSKCHAGLLGARDDMIDVHGQATAGLARDRVVVDGSGDGNALSGEVGRQLDGRRECTTAGAEQEGRQR